METQLDTLDTLLKDGHIKKQEHGAKKGAIYQAISVMKVLSARPLPDPITQLEAAGSLASLVDKDFWLREQIITDPAALKTVVGFAEELCAAYKKSSKAVDIVMHLMRALYSLAGRNQRIEMRDDLILNKFISAGVIEQVVVGGFKWNKDDLLDKNALVAACYCLGIAQECSEVFPETCLPVLNSEEIVSTLAQLQKWVFDQNDIEEAEGEEVDPTADEQRAEIMQLALILLWKFLALAIKLSEVSGGSKAIKPEQMTRIFTMISMMTFDPPAEDGDDEEEEGDACCGDDDDCCGGKDDCCGGDKKEACCENPEDCKACDKPEKKQKKSHDHDHHDHDHDHDHGCGDEECEDECCMEDGQESDSVDQFDINASCWFAKMALDPEFVKSDMWVDYTNAHTTRTLPYDLGQLAGKLLSSSPDDRVITNCLVALCCLRESPNSKVAAAAKKVIELLIDDESGVLDKDDLMKVEMMLNQDALSYKRSSGFEIIDMEDEEPEDDDDEDGQQPASGPAADGRPEGPAVVRAVKAGFCTFTETNTKFTPQYFFECKECKMQPGEGICVVCAQKCHAGHKLTARKHSMKFYCDCGAAHAESCKALRTK